ncbi:MAG: hypothetical protein WC067_01250 [Candidatus Methanomethylophilaceae archaeon]
MEVEKRRLVACMPGKEFPSISVTGAHCDEMCEHCMGVHLQKMIPVHDGKELMTVAEKLSEKKCTGMLISGGCDTEGKVPLGHLTDEIRGIVGMGLSVNVHAGFASKKDIERLVSAGVKRFSVDIHQDPDVISSILHLQRDPSEYSELLDEITNAGGVPIPHLTVGFGIRDLSLSARLVQEKRLTNIVLLALVPTKGTGMECVLPTEDSILSAAETLVNNGFNVTLGCMRDRRNRNLEIKCIERGIRRIANPSKETVTWAASEGFEIVREHQCCCMSL